MMGVVKRKRTLGQEIEKPKIHGDAEETLLIPEGLVDQARLAYDVSQMKKPVKCVVCNDPCAPNSVEGLCWVCRRLKLSAWRDSDLQTPAQE